MGTFIAQRLKKTSPRADPIICACGLIISAPMLAGSMLVVSANTTLAYLLVFFGSVALNLNWAIVADILLVRIYSWRVYELRGHRILGMAIVLHIRFRCGIPNMHCSHPNPVCSKPIDFDMINAIIESTGWGIEFFWEFPKWCWLPFSLLFSNCFMFCLLFFYTFMFSFVCSYCFLSFQLYSNCENMSMKGIND